MISRRGLEQGIRASLCAGILCAGGFLSAVALPLTAAGEAPVAASSDAVAAAQSGDTTPATTVDPDNPAATINPTPAPSPSGMNLNGDEAPLPQQTLETPPPPLPTPAPTPEATPEPSPEPTPESVEPEVLPPLPGATSSQQAGASGLVRSNPALQPQLTDWNLSNVQSPLFLNAAIDEFNERPLMLVGNWSLIPHLSVSDVYNGNIFIKSGGADSDFVTEVSPGFDMRLGNDDSMFYLDSDYTTGFNYYIQHPGDSSINQDLRTQFQWTLPKTVLAATVDVSSDKGADIDVSDLVRRTLYFAGLTAHYTVGEKTSWDVSGSYTRSDFGGLISSSEYDANIYLDYQYSPKTQFGLGASGGYLIVPKSQDQLYEGANLRATYHATEKLTLLATAGMDVRQTQGGVGTSLTPVFVINATWNPRVGTNLSLSAQRSIYASAILNDQNYTATSMDFTIQQRITDYVSLSLGLGYVNTDYTATVSTVQATREDNYYYVRPALEWKALTWLSIGIFYEYNKDVSTGGEQASSFEQDSGGLQFGISF